VGRLLLLLVTLSPTKKKGIVITKEEVVEGYNSISIPKAKSSNLLTQLVKLSAFSRFVTFKIKLG